MRYITGIQPSGQIHIGNYFGAIHPFLQRQQGDDVAYCCVANYHAMTSIENGKHLHELTFNLVLDLLALGVNNLYRQSDIPEVFELMWVFSNLLPKSFLDKAHAYKDKVSKGITPNMGLFTYPILMAADILLHQADSVIVGHDQTQHVQIARDIALRFNRRYIVDYDPQLTQFDWARLLQWVMKLPDADIIQKTTIPGTDGSKMSKSRNNTLDIFANDDTITKKVMGIKTDSSSVKDPKNPDATPLYALINLFATDTEKDILRDSFLQGGYGYGHYKKQLIELFHRTFDEARARRVTLARHPSVVEDILKEKCTEVRELVGPTIQNVRTLAGV